jgi:predicted NBD/HSP70 family sugar kinase
MQKRGHSLIKSINRAKILDAIRKNSPASRTHVARITGLDKKTLTNFVSEFIAEGLIEEAGKEERDVGRPFTLLQFREKLVAGIDIEPDRVSGVLTDLTGAVRRRAEISYPLLSERAVVIDSVRRLYGELKKDASLWPGAGIALPGVMDMQNSVVLGSVNMPSLDGMNFHQVFSEIVGGLFYVEESSRAKALAEKWFGDGRAHGDFVCVDLGIGVGSGIVSGRRLYRGAGMFAGEIGHLTVRSGGKKCRCGNSGCLEAYLSEAALLEEISGILGARIKSFQEIPSSETERLRSFLENAGSLLGHGLAAVINIMCPDLIIINGALTDSFGGIVMPAAVAEAGKCSIPHSFERVKIIRSSLSGAGALGAASLVFSQIFECGDHYTA